MQHNLCITDLYLLWCVIYWLPVRYSTHSLFAIPKLLTKRSVLRLRVSTSVSVVEGDIEEKRPLLAFHIIVLPFTLWPLFKDFLLVSLEKLADQEFDAGDVPPHLEDRAVLLRVGKIKRIN